MIPDNWPLHGGQANPLLARFGLPETLPVLDVSANLNPLGPPTWLADWLAERMTTLSRYPDPDYTEARTAIADKEGVDTDHVLLTNGGAEAIFLAAALHAGESAAIVQPGFAEYRRACAAHGLSTLDIPLAPPEFCLEPESAFRASDGCRLLFLCRPHNPTGKLVPRRAMERLLALTAERGCRLVVDEAFIDFVDDPNEALTPLLARFDHLILLRSLTKLHSLPGLRIGYLLADPRIVQHASTLQPAWSVNSLAAGLVPDLLEDHDFLTRTHEWLMTERPRLHAGLESLGLEVVPSQANFFLIRHREGKEATRALLPALLRRGILIRHTESFAGLEGEWLRLAVLDAESNDRLLAALVEVLDDIGAGDYV
ncbi:threonine-phosphate decarboxylase CobD [Aidingimonas halophila]|uniref:threonine-phosphate decarboxylase n=1 Tax=Aidingimonas halophila TaxID=574349 RepID=A0A1H2XHU1_9GAMM|nr:threonine-phosphate decarboxylase CobD [Aidingimonas halophila]GHC28772.1 threonine-phosphate decarboxylase [Aidingimonas halophila]SDW92463.1 L-threonine O-3-phosphate decarboxylase [Aidingimonas halophila]